MDWQNDPELEKLFREELDERSSSLAEGGRAMVAGAITQELSGRMLREGHTIKGTGRVMGYEGIARGGETCEFVWRFIQQRDLQPSSMLGHALVMLAEAIPHGLDGEHAGISESIQTVREIVTDEPLLEMLPEPLEEEQADAPVPVADTATEPVEPVELGESEADVPASESDDVGAVEAAPEAIDEVVIADGPDAPDEAESSGFDADDVAESQDSDEPLVFEPGPDGKLPTPQITYELVPETHVEEPLDTPVEAPTEHDVEVPADNAVEAPVIDGGEPPEPVSVAPAQEAPTESDAPPMLTVVEDKRSVLDPVTSQAYDLGGLVGAVETWATEESVPVNAGRLFRMINDVAAVRVDIDSAVRQASYVAMDSGPSGSSSAADGLIESLETIRHAMVQLESAALGLTVIPVSSITSTLPQLVKYLSKKVGRRVDLVVEGEDTLIDRQLLDRIGEIVRQFVVNAVAHGLEPEDVRVASGKASVGTVRVATSRDDQHVKLTVSDDGAGIDWASVREKAIAEGLVGDDPTSDDLRSVLYSDGFSTDHESTEFTGTGSGLGRVTEIVEEVFGSMTLDSTPGRGTTFAITMPAHRALQRAQMFTAGGRTWGMPESAVIDVIPITKVSISVTEKGTTIGFRESSVPYSSFSAVAGLEIEGLPAQVLIAQSPTGLIALAVDEVLAIHEVVTKDLGPLLSGSSVVSGVALLGGDETVMLVDAGRLADRLRSADVMSTGPVRRVLVVDDSQGVRQVVSGVLASHGFSTASAGSVSEALAALSRSDVDALVVDFSMPRADGVALVHMVRQRYGNIPIVMLSGVASDEDRSRAERAGVNAFFDKADFARGALVETLRKLIDEAADAEPNGDAGSVKAS